MTFLTLTNTNSVCIYVSVVLYSVLCLDLCVGMYYTYYARLDWCRYVLVCIRLYCVLVLSVYELTLASTVQDKWNV